MADPRIPRSGDRILTVSALAGGVIAVASPFLAGLIKWADWKLGDWVDFGTQYQAVFENALETALVLGVGKWWMSRIRQEDAALDVSFSARPLVVPDDDAG